MSMNVMWDVLRDAILARVPRNSVIKGRYALIGCGGVGTWMALLMLLSAEINDFQLVCIDDDKLELVNANRLPYPLSWFAAGLPKVEAFRLLAERLRPGARIAAIPLRFSKDNDALIKLLEETDVVIDAVDNMAAIREVWEVAREIRKPLLSLHYDGWHGDVLWVPGGVEPPAIWGDSGGQGYTAPSVAAVPAALAAIGIRLLIERPKEIVHLSF